MTFLQRMIAEIIERVFKNKISTVIGVLVLIGGALGGVTGVVSEDLVIRGVHVKATLATISALIGGVVLVLSKDSKPDTINKDGKVTKLGLLLLFCFLTAAAASAQDNFVVGGLSYNPSGVPSISGTGVYGRQIVDKTWLVSIWDALPSGAKPYTVQTTAGVGVAQNLAQIGKYPIYCLTGAGFSWTGQNSGWAYNGGCATAITIKDKWFAMPMARFYKSSVGGAGYQAIVGATFGLWW